MWQRAGMQNREQKAKKKMIDYLNPEFLNHISKQHNSNKQLCPSFNFYDQHFMALDWEWHLSEKVFGDLFQQISL